MAAPAPASCTTRSASRATPAATAPSASTYRPSGSSARHRRPPALPKIRAITRWLLTNPDSLDQDEAVQLKQARERCPHLDALAGHVTAFAEILTGRHGDRLDDWIAAVEADDQPDLHSFAHCLKAPGRDASS